MAVFEFNNDRDAAMRLGSSIVLLKGVPVWVEEATKNSCRVITLDGKEEKVVKTKNLNLEPVTGGNVQLGKSYLHVQRIPVRRWKQGLNRENIKISKMPWMTAPFRVMTENMHNTIVNNYPDAVKAINEVVDGVMVAVAFSKRWGVGFKDGITRLYYKDEEVGVVEKGEITLYAKKFYLRESLLEALNV